MPLMTNSMSGCVCIAIVDGVVILGFLARCCRSLFASSGSDVVLSRVCFLHPRFGDAEEKSRDEHEDETSGLQGSHDVVA